MIHQLTEEQQKIVDHARAFGNRSAAERFSVTYGSVCYLLDKDRRIKESQDIPGRFVEVRLHDQTPAVSPAEDSVSFMIGTATIRMSISDFRKAFGI